MVIPECPDASRVGRVEISSGAGDKPLWVPQAGKKPTAVYLTEAYKGGRFGLSVVVPAQAGPFDLGWVVDRLSLHVDERTTQLTVREEQSRLYDAAGNLKAVNDGAIPRVLDGIFLNIRDIRVHMDKPGFMVNPTDCSQMQVGADIASYGGKTATVSNRFRAADCALLGFKPQLSAKILPQLEHRPHPPFRALRVSPEFRQKLGAPGKDLTSTGDPLSRQVRQRPGRIPPPAGPNYCQ